MKTNLSFSFKKRNLLTANYDKHFKQPFLSPKGLFIEVKTGKMRRNSGCNLNNRRTYKQHYGSYSDRFTINPMETSE